MMEWSWSTFLVEIVNFVLLIWLLTHFLYRPVARAIADRRQAIAQASERSDQVMREGETLRKGYEERAAEWEREKAGLKEQFERELTDERARRESALEAELRKREERADGALRAREQENLRRLERLANEEAAKFCAHLLARFASTDLERRLIDATIEDLSTLPAEERATLAHAFNQRDGVTIATRYSLAAEQRTALLGALRATLGQETEPRFHLDDAVVAGLRADLGTMMLEANLADELRWFAGSDRAVTS